MRGLDPDRDQLSQLLSALRATYKDQQTTFTVADLARLAEETKTELFGKPVYTHFKLREVMMFYGKINTRSFGHLLRRHLDRTDDGWGIN